MLFKPELERIPFHYPLGKLGCDTFGFRLNSRVCGLLLHYGKFLFFKRYNALFFKAYKIRLRLAGNVDLLPANVHLQRHRHGQPSHPCQRFHGSCVAPVRCPADSNTIRWWTYGGQRRAASSV